MLKDLLFHDVQLGKVHKQSVQAKLLKIQPIFGSEHSYLLPASSPTIKKPGAEFNK
jgi:hypothetical protein